MMSRQPETLALGAEARPAARHLTLTPAERKVIIATVDGVLGAVACQLAVLLDFWYIRRPVGVPKFGMLFFFAAWPVVLFSIGGYSSRSLSERLGTVTSVAKALPLVALLGAVVFFTQPYRLNRPSIVLALVIGAPAVLAGRLLMTRVLGHRLFASRAILVEPPVPSAPLERALVGGGHLLLARVPGTLTVEEITREVTHHSAHQRVDELILPSNASQGLGALIETAVERGWRVVSTSALVEQQQGRVPIDEVDSLWYLALAQHQSLPRPYVIWHRATDLVMAAFLALLTAPVVGAAALAIKLSSPGPALLRQRRVGELGAEFDMYKLRTMRQDAEQGGPAWTAPRDQRITAVGRFLRRTRIDELPQMLNIVRGEMSFIGPRPERPEFVRLLEHELPHYRTRLTVKPGITGWAQVQAGYAGSILESREKLAYDLYYVKYRSLRLDLQIAVMTLFIVLGLRGR